MLSKLFSIAQKCHINVFRADLSGFCLSILFYSSLTLEPTTLRGWEDIAAFKSEMAAIGSPIDLEEDTAIAASQSTHDSDDDLWDEQEIYYKGFTSSSNNSFNQDDE